MMIFEFGPNLQSLFISFKFYAILIYSLNLEYTLFYYLKFYFFFPILGELKYILVYITYLYIVLFKA